MSSDMFDILLLVTIILQFVAGYLLGRGHEQYQNRHALRILHRGMRRLENVISQNDAIITEIHDGLR
jgi:hypothetical protein